MSTARHLYEQLAEDLTGLIGTGTLRPGDRLPSVRLLSEQRGVSISTVLQAYLLLESRGYVETRPQSGHYVRSRRLALVQEPRPARVRAAAHARVGERPHRTRLRRVPGPRHGAPRRGRS